MRGKLSSLPKKVLKLARLSKPRRKPTYKFSRDPEPGCESAQAKELRQIRNLLNYTKTSGSSYAATRFPAGYHTVEISGERLIGQRDPCKRLEQLPITLDGKTVLDIGTNQGGMLLAVKDSMKWGIGIDRDPHMINAANRIRASRSASNLLFYVFDVEEDPIDLIFDIVPGGRIDVVFLLSVCKWIKNWQELIAFCSAAAPHMLFESNGTDEQQKEQERVLRCYYSTVSLLSETSEDDPGQKRRRLFFCEESQSAR